MSPHKFNNSFKKKSINPKRKKNLRVRTMGHDTILCTFVYFSIGQYNAYSK